MPERNILKKERRQRDALMGRSWHTKSDPRNHIKIGENKLLKIVPWFPHSQRKVIPPFQASNTLSSLGVGHLDIFSSYWHFLMAWYSSDDDGYHWVLYIATTQCPENSIVELSSLTSSFHVLFSYQFFHDVPWALGLGWRSWYSHLLSALWTVLSHCNEKFL